MIKFDFFRLSTSDVSVKRKICLFLKMIDVDNNQHIALFSEENRLAVFM